MNITLKKMSLSLIALLTANIAYAAPPALLNVVQTFPDTTLTNNYIKYDSNGFDSDTGLLSIISIGASLNLATGGASNTVAQSYFSAGDSVPELTLTFKIANGTGTLAAGTFEGGNVSIGFGNAVSNPRFSWTGNIINYGMTADMKSLDATWQLTGDAYQNLPAAFSQFVDGAFTNSFGGIKLNNVGFSAARTDAQLFNQDWLFGSGANSTTNPAYLSGLTNPTLTQGTNAIDVFITPVPEPEAYALMLLGLGLLGLRRKFN